MNKMLPIKTIILAVTVISFLYSCSKKEGCNFNEALNYDNEVVVDDGTCNFTKFTFYADTTYLIGLPIKDIKIKVDKNTVGTFSGMEYKDNACSGSNITSYTPSSVEMVNWTSEIHLFSSTIDTSFVDSVMVFETVIVDTVLFTSGESRTSPDIECLEIDVLPK